MKNKKLITAEIFLIIGSVFIFRSLWTIFDSISWMNLNSTLWIFLAAGLGITVVSLRYMEKEKK